MTRFIVFFLIMVMLGGVFWLADDAALAMSDKICRGLVVADVPVGGLTAAEAERKLAAALKLRQETPLTVLRHGENRWEIPWSVVAGKPQPAQLAEQAYAVGRSGNVLQRMYDQFMVKNGQTIPVGLQADKEQLAAIAAMAAKSVDRPPVNATIVESGGGTEIRPERPGTKTRIEDTVNFLQAAIRQGNAGEVALVVETLLPTVVAKDLQEINGLLGAFSTTFDATEANRAKNIEIAANALDGSLVRAGSVFSFNDRVGQRTPEKGYLQAVTLSSEGPVMDWGGGVCQVSTTLYNAALLADFSVVERSAHYQPPAYVPLGLDATVADGQIDLKLKNVRPQPVLIRSAAEGGRVEVRIYGKREGTAPTVRVESAERTIRVAETFIKQDPALPFGHEVVDAPGSNGYDVTVYRIKSIGLREISREKISFDEFPGTDRVVRVGTHSDGDGETK